MSDPQLDTDQAEPARQATPAPQLSIVVPCFNERPNVRPLIARLDEVLAGRRWEAIFVDDNSPDGTAAELRQIGRTDARIRCLRRVGRRGLASAVIEGALASTAEYVAVIDGDLQHDETRLPAMLALLEAGDADLVVASRHVAGGDATGLASPTRHAISGLGARLARAVMRPPLTDPMSGFFMLGRALFEQLAPLLAAQGFKILLDLILSAPAPLRVIEIPSVFRSRAAGTSKLDPQVLMQFLGLLADKLLGGLLPLRFLAFASVGLVGLLVHLAVLILLRSAGLGFEPAQIAATLVAMLSNFELNNRITYADQRLRGARLARGLMLFVLVCGLGAIANVGIAQALYAGHYTGTLAGAAGAAVGLVWNYAVSATLVWRAR